MSVWQHAYATRDLERQRGTLESCPFCNEVFEGLSYIGEPHHAHDGYVSDFRGGVCKICGWWRVILYRNISRRDIERHHPEMISEEHIVPNFVHSIHAAHATLKEFDLKDLKSPILEVRNYLLAKYKSRFEVNPRLMEEVVASVFRDLGWNTAVTAYSKDNGIDVILTNGDEIVAVQVKRSKNKIEVDQIRSFTGALVENKITQGIFVTVSSFTRGSKSHVQTIEPEYRVHLYDAERLFDALKITRRIRFQSVNELFFDLGLNKISLEDPETDELFEKCFRREMGGAVLNFREE